MKGVDLMNELEQEAVYQSLILHSDMYYGQQGHVTGHSVHRF